MDNTQGVEVRDEAAEALALVKSLTERGFRLEREGRRLFVSPGERLTEADRNGIRRLKAYVLATLPPETAGTAGTAERQEQPAWDQARADRALADVNTRLDAVLAAGASPALRRVAEVYRELAAGYHARRDRLLFEVGPSLDRKGWGA